MLKNSIKTFFKIHWPLLLALTIALGFFVLCAVGFIALADEVRDGDTLSADSAILQALNNHSSKALDIFFIGFTQLGGVFGVAIISIVLAGLLAYRHRYFSTIVVVAGVGGAAIINHVLKSIFERSRPDLWQQIITETSFSFPSGHAMASSALALVFIAVFWRTKYRWTVTLSAIVYTILIGLSRMYLGVHYPTDILAGWLVSGAWVIVVLSVVYGVRKYRRRLRTLATKK